jgi:hypothetical protein
MSSPLAIAAVTATLRNLLSQGVTPDQDLADTTITAQPPDKARGNASTANQINLFLYQVSPNPAWRNQDMPGLVHPGETSAPPLALNLFYLLTPYGRDNDVQRPYSHHLLGRAMSVIHDHPLLSREEINSALPDSDLHTQVERVRFTLQPISLDEVSKLWAGFQTPLRLSVAYEAAVLLIESSKPAKTPLPVLARGRNDSGITAVAGLVPPFPTIVEIVIPGKRTSAQLSDLLTITGHHLTGDRVVVVFINPHLTEPVRLSADATSTAERVTVTMPDDPDKWVAGFYTVAIAVTDGIGTASQMVRTTNEVSFTLAPVITSAFPIRVARTAKAVRIPVTVSPEVTPEQRVALLIESQAVPAEAHSARTDQVHFVIPEATPGEYLVRIRVDGVDSELVDRSGVRPIFRNQKVIIT